MSLRAHDLPAGPVPQRRNRRFPVELWAEERATDGVYHHRVTNLSATGMFFQKSVAIPLGRTFLVQVKLPTGKVIRGQGTVVHATATEDGPGYGISLSRMPHEDRDALVDFLCGIPLV